MSEWREKQFSELCDITRGGSPRPIKDYIASEGMPWVKIADATSSASRFLSRTKERIRLEGVPRSVTVYPGDLILSNSATPGLPKFMEIEACIHDGWMLLRNFRGLDKRFAYWLLLNERKNLVMQGNGSVFTNLKTDILKNHIVRIPEEAGQLRIADILDGIAAKLELNRQINQTLEQIAQAIFKSWFVDFEPVKAKQHIRALGGNDEQTERAAQAIIAGAVNLDVITTATDLSALDQQLTEALSEKLTHQIDVQREQLATTASHFPDQLVESELGLVPEGWAPTATLESLIELAYGKALKKNDRNPGPFPVYGSGGVTGNHDAFLVDGPGVVVGRKGTVGSLYWEDSPFFPIDTVFFVKVVDDVPLTFAFYLLQTLGLEDMNTDAAVPGLNRNNAYRLDVPGYPGVLMASFADYANGFREQMRANGAQTTSLISLRDSLLPKLLSGELEVEKAA